MNILNFIQEYLRNPILDPIMVFLSAISDNGYFWILTGLMLFIFKKYRIISVKLASALVLGVMITNLTLKPWFERVRPCNVESIKNMLETCPDTGSFPSGHTTAIFAGATVLYMINKKIGIGAYILAGLVGISRMYLYVHFPTDVLAGICVGVFAGIVGPLLVDIIYPKVSWKWAKKFIPKTY